MVSNVTSVRKARGLTSAALAAAAGVSHPTLLKLERGELMAVRAASLVAVAEALGLSVVALFPALAQAPADWSEPYTESYANPK